MPLVVSSLTGDASDVFDWILSLNQCEPQDLTTLLQMLREHYCGSLTFREQRNTIEKLCQKPNEAAIDFSIRVGTSVSNLAKDWKDELAEGELQALQYEVSLNGVREEIRHVLDSEMAKRDSHLTPQQIMRLSRGMRPTWPKTSGSKVRVRVLQLVNRRLPVSPQATSLGSTRQQHSLPQLVDWKMRLVPLKIPLLMRILTPRRQSLLTRMMKGCTSLVTLRRLCRMILHYRLRWLALCDSKR